METFLKDRSIFKHLSSSQTFAEKNKGKRKCLRCLKLNCAFKVKSECLRMEKNIKSTT